MKSTSDEAVFWGKNGHRVTGKIAEKHLTRKTKKCINKKNLFEYNTMAIFQESTSIEEVKLMEIKCHNQASEEQGRYKAKKRNTSIK